MMNLEHPALAAGPVYLDYNATTPLDPRVIEAMRPYLESRFGNPSSDHAYAAQPRQAIDEARCAVAALLGANPGEIVFTGSGSEADTLAIRGAVLAAKPPHVHVVTQITEHPAVLETCRALARLHDVEVTYLPVDRDGLVDPTDLAAAITPHTAVVSIMAANNETGALQPIAALARTARENGTLFHCDAAQAAGKIPIDVAALGVDLLTVVGHKMYAPKGIAALYIRDGVELEPVIYGGGQEKGLRAGTENVPYAVALGAASRLAAEDLAGQAGHRIRILRDRLHERLAEAFPGRLQLNGPAEQRLPNTLNVSIAGIRGHDLLAATPGVAASTGSACHSGIDKPSPVLTAMGADDARAMTAVRLSLGRWTTQPEIDLAAALLAEAGAAPGAPPCNSHETDKPRS